MLRTQLADPASVSSSRSRGTYPGPQLLQRGRLERGVGLLHAAGNRTVLFKIESAAEGSVSVHGQGRGVDNTPLCYHDRDVPPHVELSGRIRGRYLYACSSETLRERLTEHNAFSWDEIVDSYNHRVIVVTNWTCETVEGAPFLSSASLFAFCANVKWFHQVLRLALVGAWGCGWSKVAAVISWRGTGLGPVEVRVGGEGCRWREAGDRSSFETVFARTRGLRSRFLPRLLLLRR